MGITYESKNFRLSITTETAHRLRRDLIKAVIKYIKSGRVKVYDTNNTLVPVKVVTNREEIEGYIQKTLSLLTASVKEDKIDYDYFDDNGPYNYLVQTLPYFCLGGLHALVSHVDDSTFFTVGQIVDILWLHTTLEDFLDEYSKSGELFNKLRVMCEDSISPGESRPIWSYVTPDYLE